MHDFIEKPSRMILVVIGLITLVTIGILLARSGLVNPGGESLVNSKGKPAVTKAPLVPKAEDAEEIADYQEEYADDGYDPYEEEQVWEAETQQPAETNPVTEDPEAYTQEPDYQEDTDGLNDQADEGFEEPWNGEAADADHEEDIDTYWDEIG